MLAEPGDLLQADAKPTEVAACDVAWSPDKKNLAIVQSDAGCTTDGKVVRLPARQAEADPPVARRRQHPDLPTGEVSRMPAGFSAAVTACLPAAACIPT